MSRFAEYVCRPAVEGARDRRIYGLVVGKVLEKLDDDTYTVEYDSIGTKEISQPARVVMPMAGKGRGIYFLPEKGDEVVLAFEMGDPSLPVILGAVWNEDQPPPAQVTPRQDNDARAIVSRSGHALTFDDRLGHESITLRSSRGHELRMNDSRGSQKLVLKTAGGVEITFDDQTKRLSINAGTSVSISASTISLNGQLIVNGVPYQSHVHTGGLLTPVGLTGPIFP